MRVIVHKKIEISKKKYAVLNFGKDGVIEFEVI